MRFLSAEQARAVFKKRIKFIEIGTDKDYAHFLIQSIPMYGAKRIIQAVKSITTRVIFIKVPEVKKKL